MTDPFEALAESCGAIVFITDMAVRMLYASSSLERQTGLSLADFQFPQPDNPFVHREDADRVAQLLTAFTHSDERVCEPFENRFLDRWGRTHRVRSTVSKIDYRGELALLFVCHAVRATPITSADDRQYRALVESADDAIVRFDNAGRILFANRRAHELLEYSAIDLGRLRLDDVVAPRDRGKLTDELTRSVGTREPVRFALQLRAKSGSVVPFQAAVTSLGSYGHPGELLAILRPNA